MRQPLSIKAFGAVAVLAFLAACGNKEEAAQPSGSAGTNAEVQQTLSAAEQSLQAGSYDEAAATLLKSRMAGQQFTPQEAASYRRTLSEAYSRALEAAEKGDPKAQAAVQMLRAGGH